ncbi:bifunctional DNA primase/polymerase [Nocardioides sp. NPDC057772]|uniref:bifunctional DNA primase/polymerase n=1 Tax=Nocardioides sp. NPDC057772 TaxID=3346245 RepID=UPI00366F2285
MTQQPDTLTDTRTAAGTVDPAMWGPAQKTTDALTAALGYAARGWRVFPLLPGSKRPATPNHRAAECDGTDAWCRTGHTGWEQRATSRGDWITRAWSSNPGYGVGIACGPSRLVVVDLDTHKPGTEIPEPWKRFEITTGADVLDHLAGVHGGTITPTYTVQTVSGGTHLYYTVHDTGRRFTNTAGKIGWLIDTRAHGGYVAAPPTRISTSAYTVTDDRPPARLPMFLLDLLTRNQQPAARATQGRAQDGSERSARPIRHGGSGEAVRHRDAYVNRVFDIAINGDKARGVTGLLDARDGGRNTALFVAAATVGKLVAGGLVAESAALDRLMAAAAGHIAAGAYTPYGAESTILSGFRRAATRRTAA